MRDPAYRRQQWEDRWAPHVAPVNALVDRLSADPGQAGVPYVAPVYGGVHASAEGSITGPILAVRSGRDGIVA